MRFEGLEEPKKSSKSYDHVRKIRDEAGKKRKRLDPDHPDFDSEEEYGRETDGEESEAELDDGR